VRSARRRITAALGAAAIGAALGASLLGGCSAFAAPDARLCSAAQNLSAAMALTATAIAADDRGDLAQAQGLATQARSLTELAHGILQQVPDEEQPKDAWQRLLEVYLHTGQAANSLLPAYAGAHGMGPEELASAAASMDKARVALPAMCFDIPGDLETPGSS
jgi:hypothetical protein